MSFTTEFLSLIIANAHAEGAPAAAAGQPNIMGQMAFFAVIFVLFYFLLIRPQSKRVKEHRAMVTALAKGDEVVTNGGVLGRVTQLSDLYLTVEIADGVEVRIERGAVAKVLPKGTLKSA